MLVVSARRDMTFTEMLDLLRSAIRKRSSQQELQAIRLNPAFGISIPTLIYVRSPEKGCFTENNFSIFSLLGRLNLRLWCAYEKGMLAVVCI